MGHLHRFYSLLMVVFVLACSGQGPSAMAVLPSEDSARFKITRLDLNSDGSDFSPVLMRDTLIFVSGRPAKLGVSYSGDQNTEVTDLFYAGRRDSVNFSKAKGFPGAINSKYNEGPFTLSTDGNMLYFSGNARPAARTKATPALQVYGSKKINGQWTA